MRLSILDRAHTRKGQSDAGALQDTAWLARHAEELGYHRFWVAEHHGVPGVAGSAPTVLVAAIAAATERIRVGTGGVMLPNHRPLVVAEQFGVLEALYPGRIDMGLGRSVGFTNEIRRALGVDKAAADDFRAQLSELLGYFTGSQKFHPGVHAHPPEGLRVPAFILATGAGAEHAAEFGLPLVITAIRGADDMIRLIDRYRSTFRPSAASTAPYVIVARSVAVAKTTEAARELSTSEAWSTAYSRTHGVFPPLLDPDEAAAQTMSPKERDRFDEAMRGPVHGTAEQVGATLRDLAQATGADEILVTTSAFDRERLLDSHRRLAESMGSGRRLAETMGLRAPTSPADSHHRSRAGAQAHTEGSVADPVTRRAESDSDRRTSGHPSIR